MSKHNMLDHSTYRKLTEVAIATENSKILFSTKEEFVQRKVTSNQFDTNNKNQCQKYANINIVLKHNMHIIKQLSIYC